jgi:methyl-CpG-binding domain protein 4
MTSDHCELAPSPPPSSPPSPPFSPLSSFDDELPVALTDDWGMVIGYENQDASLNANAAGAGDRAPALQRGSRKAPTYFSRHFSQDGGTKKSNSNTPSKRRKRRTGFVIHGALATPPQTPAKPLSESSNAPRIYYGINVDELSSDSDLTDVPDDIGPDPFEASPSTQIVAVARPEKKSKKHTPTRSPFFTPKYAHKPRPHFLSTLPFPPLEASRFGLMQERLAHDPFRLLIATIFLNKTPGERAMPVFYTLMEKYPTPEALAAAEISAVTEVIQKLGFQNQRARKMVAMAQKWIECPPTAEKRYGKRDYPRKGDGRDIKENEVLGPESMEAREGWKGKVGWEIGHLPGAGPYAHDSWRMFCRDSLLGKANGWNGEGAADGFEPEWKRVLPLDKELRAWMAWMWLKEGWVWNKETGDKERASEQLMITARGGGVILEEREKETLTVQSLAGDIVIDRRKSNTISIQRPAGDGLDDEKISGLATSL